MTARRDTLTESSENLGLSARIKEAWRLWDYQPDDLAKGDANLGVTAIADATTNFNCKWIDRNPTAAYIHIPFCQHRCGYCNFAVVANRGDLMEQYLDALEKELALLKRPRSVETIFIGGGTPTQLPAALLQRLFELIKYWLPSAVGAEFTIEANPADIDEQLCKTLLRGGINRVSLGIQSFDDQKLIELDRYHTGRQSLEAIKQCQTHFQNVSVDLIFGAPNETLATWKSDLETAIQCGVKHVSTYALTIEKGTKFWSLNNRSELKTPGENAEAVMFETAINVLQANSFEHYEISSFAKPDFQCRHNHKYWSGDTWLAFGAGAARMLGRVRSTNHASTSRYLQMLASGVTPIALREELLHSEWTIDRFVFGMRRRTGVDMKELELLADRDSFVKIESETLKAVNNGWMEQVDSVVRLTDAGLMISDALWPLFYRQ